jgi:hypothetical protein
VLLRDRGDLTREVARGAQQPPWTGDREAADPAMLYAQGSTNLASVTDPRSRSETGW